MLGGIEAGGTKFVCAVGTEDGTIIDRIEIPTAMPDETIEKVIQYFRQFSLQAIGIGSFGPVDLDVNSKTYGTITATPKPGWRHYPFLKTIKEEMNIPVGFSTDVNAAALGESLFGAAKDFDSCLYITVGTGIGAGAIIEGRLLQGLSHPEMGHIYIRRHPDDTYQGKCPYHKDCFEGLASGPAIESRWGKRPQIYHMLMRSGNLKDITLRRRWHNISSSWHQKNDSWRRRHESESAVPLYISICT